MSVTFVKGDILLADTDAIAIGLNAMGRLGVSPLHTTLLDRYPVFVSEYHRRGRAQAFTPGDIWVWKESEPWLVGMIVRDALQSAARLRYVEMALLNLYKNWEREGLRSLAMVRLDGKEDWASQHAMICQYLHASALRVDVYAEYAPSMAAEALPAECQCDPDPPV